MDEVKRVHALVQHADALMAEAHREMRHGNVNVASEVLRVAARTYRAAGRDTSARVAEHLLAQQNGGEALAMVEREMAKGHYDHAVRGLCAAELAADEPDVRRATAGRIHQLRREIIARTGEFIAVPCARWSAKEVARVERELRICAAGGSIWLRSWTPLLTVGAVTAVLAIVGLAWLRRR